MYWSANSDEPTRSAIVSCWVACHRELVQIIAIYLSMFQSIIIIFDCSRAEYLMPSLIKAMFWEVATYHLVEVVHVKIKEVVILERRRTIPCILGIYLK